MRGLEQGFHAVARAGLLAGMLAAFPVHSVRADDNAEPAITRTQYEDITRIESSSPDSEPPALPVTIHKLNDAEKGEMDRMHAVRVVKGKDWRDMTPQQRYDRVKSLRETMPGVSLMLTAPGGDLWAVPPGENGVNFDDILKKNLVRIWRLDEVESLHAVNSNSGNNPRDGRQELARVEPEKKTD